jgi:hypothetical protein
VLLLPIEPADQDSDKHADAAERSEHADGILDVQITVDEDQPQPDLHHCTARDARPTAIDHRLELLLHRLGTIVHTPGSLFPSYAELALCEGWLDYQGKCASSTDPTTTETRHMFVLDAHHSTKQT